MKRANVCTLILNTHYLLYLVIKVDSAFNICILVIEFLKNFLLLWCRLLLIRMKNFNYIYIHNFELLLAIFRVATQNLVNSVWLIKILTGLAWLLPFFLDSVLSTHSQLNTHSEYAYFDKYAFSYALLIQYTFLNQNRNFLSGFFLF